MSWVDVDSSAVSDRWRLLTTAESSIVDTLIEDAQDELEYQVRFAGYPAVDPGDELAVRTYTRTIGNMVKRLLINPEGVLEESIDGEYTYRRDKSVSSGALYVDASELDRFRPIPTTALSGAWTIRPGL